LRSSFATSPASRRATGRRAFRIRWTLCRRRHNCHPLRVAIRILSHYRVEDADVACAALLHETVEDHAGELAPGGSRDDAVAAVAGEFGGRVASLVGAVTSPQWAPGTDRHESGTGRM
jgi:(p)ppGpp synthase/HD superfamily hydrolase